MLESPHRGCLCRIVLELCSSFIICTTAVNRLIPPPPSPHRPPEEPSIGSHFSSPDRLPERKHSAISGNSSFPFVLVGAGVSAPELSRGNLGSLRVGPFPRLHSRRVPQRSLILGSPSVAQRSPALLPARRRLMPRADGNTPSSFGGVKGRIPTRP